MLYAVLVVFLVQLELIARMVIRIVIYQLMTLRAQQHEIVDGVDVLRTLSIRRSWPKLTKCDDVRLFREIPIPQGQGMFKQILVALCEFAATSSSRRQEDFYRRRDSTRSSLSPLRRAALCNV